jgi:hypothetical protein
VKKIKLDQDKLLGFKILPQTPKIGDKPMGATAGTTIKGKVGGKIGTKPFGKLGSKVGGKPDSRLGAKVGLKPI